MPHASVSKYICCCMTHACLPGKRLSDGDLVKDHTLVLGLEPLDGVVLGDLVLHTHAGLHLSPACNAETRALQAHVEVHAVNACGGVVLDAQIDVLGNAKAKVAGLREVLAQQLVLLHLEASLQQLHGLLAAHCHAARDLLIAANGEGAHGVAGLSIHGHLARQLLQHLGCLLETVTRLAHTDVQHKLGHADVPHGVAQLILCHHLGGWLRVDA
mmetsp:Transcript_7096/g.12153  ORF Transcript_7096/g.12153 Transcript_7096/m.12153 type:complete len:214 (-) Transcript_7096:33-674(-)